MTTLTDLLHALLVHGAELSIEDGKLRVRAAEGVLTAEALETLRSNKEEILRLLPEYRFEAPLSADQEGLWFIQESAPGSTAYNVSIPARIEAEDDPGPALRRALQKLVDRHTLLRTSYVAVDASPRQVVHGHRAVELVEIDAAHLGSDELLAAIASVHQRPFDLAAEGAFRACLFRRGPREVVLLLCMHHIAIDGWSIYLLIDELVRLYEADSRPNPLPPVKRTYQQFVTWQRDMLAERHEELRHAWRHELADAPQDLRLPTDHPRPPVQTFRGTTRRSELPATLVEDLRRLARDQHTTLSTLLLSAFQVLLHRYSGQDDLCVGFGVSRRDRQDFADTFGYMVNRVVIRSQSDAAAAPAFRSLLQRTHERVMNALSRQDYPFRWLVKDLLTDRDPSRPPLTQVTFLYQRTQTVSDAAVRLLGGASAVVRGARWTLLLPPQLTTETDLVLEVTEHATGIHLALRYNSDLFDAGTIDRMAQHLETLLGAIVSDPDRSAAELPLLTEAERRQVAVEWNKTEVAYSSQACIHELFEAHVDRTPDALALVDLCDPAAGAAGVRLTYQELDRRANQVAHQLIQLGVGPDVHVGVCLPRGADLIVGLLGVLKAGGAFVILDPEHRRQHLAFLLKDTEVPVVLTHPSVRAALPETGARVVELDPRLAEEPARRPQRGARGGADVTANHLAYVLYTSGSTGQPNGVLIEHRGLVNSIEAHIRLMETGPGARHAHVLSFNFDAAIAHLFVMICAGGAVYLAPRDSEFLGARLIGLLERERITHTMLVPTMLAALPDAALPELRTLVVAGERCSAELVSRWGTTRRMLNLYGPTETSILATAWRCVPDGNLPPIGQPIANLQAYVVDRWGQLAPPGVIGELWLGGVGVARGYLNRPELTAQKFVENPFVPAPSRKGRLYRTGDLVRHCLRDGRPPVLEFVARKDAQVKLHGHRIELGEVESALRACAEVLDAVATIHGGETATPRLVAYVTPTPRALSPQWDLQQIESWNAMAVERAAASAGATQSDPTLDLRGWKSSYTGLPIPEDEMRAWVESTVARILALGPREVLEVGCGTGMLLARIAPRVARYRGTDLARHAIDHVETLRAQLSLGNVAVSQQPAHDLTGLVGERFDTVVLNSVVQYFPSARYLRGVLEGVLGLVREGGSIFLGDVRNLALLPAFHASVERGRTGGALGRRELLASVQRAMVHDNELVVHPRFFTELVSAFPQITSVEISPKRGWYQNELSRFRYDVVLRIGGGAPAPAIEWHEAAAWPEAGPDGLTLACLRAWIARTGPGRGLGLRGIPNARLHEDNAWRRWLTGNAGDPTWQAPPSDPRALDPEALYALEADLPCRIQLSWSAGRPDGSFDLIATTGDGPAPRFPSEPLPVEPHGDALTNDPLAGRRFRELAANLGRELRERNPPYLVPSAIVVLPTLPLTLNGKVDVEALPPPEAQHAAGDELAEPRTEVERKLAAIWREVLGLPRVGIHDNFFELGGDSILSILIISKAQTAGIVLRAGQLFERNTIAELAAVASAEAVPADQGAVAGSVPLTPIQRWFFAQELPSPSHFNQAVLLEPPADLDLELLRQALHHLQGHHDALRTRFTRQGPVTMELQAAPNPGPALPGPTWVQDCLAEPGEVALEVVDLSSLPPDAQRAALGQAAARLQGSLDLAGGPVMRLAALRLGGDRAARLLWIIHHLVVDVVSWQVLISDLSTAYRQLAAGQPVALPSKTTSFQRWAERLTEYARGQAFTYERSNLGGSFDLAVLGDEALAPLPLDRLLDHDGQNLRASAAVVRIQLSREETQRLVKDALRPYNLAVQELLLAALAEAVGRFSDASEVWIDLEGHGREDLFDDVDLSRTVGWFTSLFPVRLAVPGDDPAEGLLAVKEHLRAIPHRGLGYGLLRYLGDDGGKLRWPTPEVSFNYLGQVRGEAEAGGGFRVRWEDVGPLWAPEGPRSHVLSVSALVAQDQLEVSFEHSRDLHDARTVERLAQDFVAAIRRMVHHCVSLAVVDAGVWTPSDFPQAGLARAELRGLVDRLGDTNKSKLEAIYPLTPIQEGMLFHTRHAETDAVYATQLALDLEGALDVVAFRAAWESALRRHAALRSCFFWDGLRAPVQVILREVALPWDERSFCDEPELDARLTSLGQELAARPIALDAAPLLRLTLVRTGDQRHVLFWDSHHLLMDGWSLPVVLREVLEDYRSLAQRLPPRARPSGSYARYLQFLDRQDRARAEAFWRPALRGFDTPTPLVIEQHRPDEQRSFRQHVVQLDAALTARLAAAAEAEHVTLATVMEGAWAMFLGRTTGLSDVLFGTVVSGRDASIPGLEDMVGLFIQTLPVRVQLDEAREVWPWLRALQADTVALREHQYTPLAQLQQIAGIPAGTHLFRSVVVFQNYPINASILGGSDLTVTYRSSFSPTHYPLVVTAFHGDTLHLLFDYDVVRFDPQRIERTAGHLSQLLRGIASAPAPRLSDLSLLTERERAQVVTEWNQTALAHDRERCIHELFEAQVVRSPNAPAVYFENRVVSYATLNRRANKLARALRRIGVVAETRVGICVDRSDEMIVSMLAVLKAGGAYVPLDAEYPPARLSQMVEDSGVALIVTRNNLCDRLQRVSWAQRRGVALIVTHSESTPWLADSQILLVELDRGAAKIAAEDDQNLPDKVSPDQLAYLIYTSGSTGQPKGVAIEHRNTVAMLTSALTQYRPEDLQGVSACASICFDYSILEIFVPLIAGGAVIVAADALALPDVPARDLVTLFSAVPSAMAALIASGTLPAGIRAVNLAGEKLSNKLVQEVYQEPGIDRVYNIYGPTETTTYSTCSLTQKDATDEPTLGRPIANTQVYLLDPHLRPVPVGVPGEIYIAGEGVSRGYWNRPELTAERFVNNLFGPGRMYKTGDLGRFRLDGEIEYLGRIDGQVKLRGFRVELGEVEATLERIPAVSKAVVVVQGDPPHQRLVAYWITASVGAAGVPDAEMLRAQLAEQLPEFMVPEIYVHLDAFPLTASGKVDRRALRPPEDADLRRGEYHELETPTEQALAALWCEILGIQRVGAHDNFIDLGGHSLLSLTMVSQVQAELGRKLPLATLYEMPTLRALARWLDASGGGAASHHPLVVPFQTQGDRVPVFCVGGYGVHVSYLHAMTPAFGPDQPFYGLQLLDLNADMPDVDRLEVLGERFADLVQEIQPSGPYVLSGHSSGARVAMAIGLTLQARGEETTIAVLDMDAPIVGEAERWDMDVSLVGYTHYISEIQRMMGDPLEVDLETLSLRREDDVDAWREVANALQAKHLLPPGDGVDLLRRTVQLRQRVFRMLQHYLPEEKYRGQLVLLSVASRQVPGTPRVPVEGWQDLCANPVQAFIVPGGHMGMVHEPHVKVVVDHLRRLVDGYMVDGAWSPTATKASFSVTWDHPEEARAMWVFDEAHCSSPMSPLDFDLRMRPMVDGINRANVVYGLPFRSEPKLIHSFVYQKLIAPDVPTEELPALLRASDVAVRQASDELQSRWDQAWLPEIQAHLAKLTAVDLVGSTLPQLLGHLAELRRRVLRLWEVHFELMCPVLVALSDFEEAYRDLFPGAQVLDVYDLLAGFPSKTVEANVRLWELGRAAVRVPWLRELVREGALDQLPAALAERPEGQALWRNVEDYVRTYGERSDDLYLDTPTWVEDPTPVLRGLREAVLQPERDLAADLRQQVERREDRLRDVRAQLASHPRPVVEEFEALLRAAQVGTVLSEDHNFWIDCKITYHARRMSLAVGARLAEQGAIDRADDVFYLTLIELTSQVAPETAAPALRDRIAERRADAARFAGETPPAVLGEMRAIVPTDCAILRATTKLNGSWMTTPNRPGDLRGMPGAHGKVVGPARIVRSLDDAHRLRPGDILIAPATLPSWTPFFATVAAVVTNVGGILCHAAVVAREYGIPAVVGAQRATEVLRDGQLVEVDGDAGVVRLVQ